MPLDLVPMPSAPSQKANQPSSGKLDLVPMNTPDQNPVFAPGKDSSDIEAPTINPKEQIPAMLGGVANAGVDTLQGTADLPAYIMSKLGIVSPESASNIYESNKQGMSLLRPQTYMPDLQRMMDENPISTGLGYYPTQIAGTAGIAGQAGKIAKMEAGTTAFGNALKQAPKALIENTAAGAITGTDQESKDFGAKFGALSTPVTSTIGALGSKMATTGVLKKQLADTVDKLKIDLDMAGVKDFDEVSGQLIQKTVDSARAQINTYYDKIKQLPGTVLTKPLQKELNKIKKVGMFKETEVIDAPSTMLGPDGKPLTTKKTVTTKKQSLLEPKQQQILQGAEASITTMKTMEDALMLKEDLAAGWKHFKVGETSTPIAKAYKQLQIKIDDLIGAKSKAAGLGDTWDTAKKYHQEIRVPQIEFGADEIADIVTQKGTNPNAYNKVEYADQLTGLIKQNTSDVKKTAAFLEMMGKQGSKVVEKNMMLNIFRGITENKADFNLQTSLKQLNTVINKFKGTLSDDTIASMKGMKALLEDAGVSTTKGSSTSGMYMAGAMAGEMAGSALGLPPGMGSLGGITLAPSAAKAIKNMLESDAGLFILRGIGNKEPWAKQARQELLRVMQTAPTVGATNQQRPE